MNPRGLYELRNLGKHETWSTREEVKIPDCISHYQYQIDHGMQLVWILFWVYPKLKGEMIPSMLWLIDFLKWHVSLNSKRPLMQHILPIYIFSEVVRLHGLPISIVSDRDKNFVGHLWRTLWKKIGINLSFISAYHPQTDVQIEVVNRSLGNILRSLVYKNPKQWDLSLTRDEFSYNDTQNQNTMMSPFQIDFRMTPRCVYELSNLGKKETRSATAKEFAK